MRVQPDPPLWDTPYTLFNEASIAMLALHAMLLWQPMRIGGSVDTAACILAFRRE